MDATAAEVRAMNARLIALLSDDEDEDYEDDDAAPRSRRWVPRPALTKVGRTWWASLRVPRIHAGGCLVHRGSGRTPRRALADLQHRTRRRSAEYRRALTHDWPTLGDQVNDWTRRKMREDGFFRKIMPPVEITNDDLDRLFDITPARFVAVYFDRVFAGWGPDGKATFRDDPQAAHDERTGEASTAAPTAG